MAVKIKKRGGGGGMDMTPMIDVVFQLMIFFLVATKLEESERELEVTLPQASQAKPITIKPKEIFINIDPQGVYLADNRIVDENGLDQFLKQAAANNPGTQRVQIRADKRVAFEYVCKVFNLCHKHNIRDFGVATADPGG